jgi:hypothetical protein
MSVTALNIIDRARAVLNDAGVQWVSADLYLWIFDGQREVIFFDKSASATTVQLSLVAGTKQVITQTTSPAVSPNVLMKVVRNMGTGTTPGATIRESTLDKLGSLFPDWNTHTAAASVSLVCPLGDGVTFYTYPPQPANTTQKLEVVLSVNPAAITTDNSTITLPDSYENLLTEYCLYRCFSKNAEYGDFQQRASGHYNVFMGLLKSSIQTPPNTKPAQG